MSKKGTFLCFSQNVTVNVPIKAQLRLKDKCGTCRKYHKFFWRQDLNISAFPSSE